MTWYWIALMIFVYTLFGAVTDGVLKRKDRTIDGADLFFIFFIWPIVMLIMFYKLIINAIANPKPKRQKLQNKKTNLSDI